MTLRVGDLSKKKWVFRERKFIPGLKKHNTTTAKTDRDKLKLFSEQLKSAFAIKIELKDKNLEREIGNFLILNIQDYSPLKSVDDHEEFIDINELDRIIKNLNIKKSPSLDSINNKLSNYAKVIMLHKAGKPEDLVGSYRPLSLTSCVGKLLEKAVADNISNWAEANKKSDKRQNGFRKNRSTNDNLFKLQGPSICKGHPTTGISLDAGQAFDQVWFDGLLFKLTSMGLNRKLIRWISNFLYLRTLIISINEQLSDPIIPIHGVPQDSLLSPILFILYVSDIPQSLMHR